MGRALSLKSMKIKTFAVLLFTLVPVAFNLPAAEKAPINENRFQENIRYLSAERDAAERLRRAKDFAGTHLLSSLQVKAIAVRLGDDHARLEFATAAYPRTVDPENFYEVYDAFTTFSKVMRLHDRIRQFERLSAGAVIVEQEAVNEDEMKDILRALRKESFDNNRHQIARQILSSSQKKFLAGQIKSIVECFTFDPARLEIAKYAYDYTLDREKYFVVNDAFSFDSNRTALSRYVASKTEAAPPGR